MVAHFGAHGRVIGAHGRVFGAHDRVLGAHDRVLGARGRVFGVDGRILGRFLGRVLAARGRVLDDGILEFKLSEAYWAIRESEAHDKYWSGMKPSVDRAIEKRMQGVLKRGPTEKKDI